MAAREGTSIERALAENGEREAVERDRVRTARAVADLVGSDTAWAATEVYTSIQQAAVKRLWDVKQEETEVVWLLGEKLKARGFPAEGDADVWHTATK